MPSGPGWSVTFLYYFTVTTLIGTLVASQSLGLRLGSVATVQLGLMVGIVAGGLGAYRNRHVTWQVPLATKASTNTFASQLQQTLQALGFSLVDVPDLTTEGVQVYGRATGGWLTGRIYVQYQVDHANLRARAKIIRQLKGKLG